MLAWIAAEVAVFLRVTGDEEEIDHMSWIQFQSQLCCSANSEIWNDCCLLQELQICRSAYVVQ